MKLRGTCERDADQLSNTPQNPPDQLALKKPTSVLLSVPFVSLWFGPSSASHVTPFAFLASSR